MPSLTVFAGPNGSGKSSIIRMNEFEGKENLLEADAIASRINPASPDRAAIKAGREVLQRAHKHLQQHQSFAIETTLSGSWTTSVIQQAIHRLFYVRLNFVCVETPELSIQRVRERVARGGHHVPDDDVRRRYTRSLTNAAAIAWVVHEALIFDNSRAQARLVLELREGVVITRVPDMPDWAASLLGTID